MTKTLDVSDLPPALVQSLEQRIQDHRDGRSMNLAGLYIKDATPAERAERLRALAASFSDNRNVIRDDRREALYAGDQRC